MRLNELDLSRLLPHFMSGDRNTQAFIYAIQSKLNEVSANIEYAKIYSRIESMNDELLDEMAWQFNVPEYNHSYSLDVKRRIIKNCMITHHNRGTVGAVKNVVKDVFGTASVSEWFEYGGSPYHFKVYTSNPAVTDEMLADLDRIIKETQNIRSYLEEVIVEMMENLNLYVGCVMIVMDDVSLSVADS